VEWEACQAEGTRGWRSTSTSSQEKITVGPPKITRFEKARIVGARALQISMSAPILIEVEGTMSSPIDIALKELESGILPITIRRTLPDGTFQDIPLKWLIKPA
jgi:DNA-directed RNA polymerase I, II, and III subunit RPABC2